MKIERYFYGMLPATGKITEQMTSNVRSMIGQKEIEYLKALKPEDSHSYVWFPSSYTIAYPIVTEVRDTREGKGGRTWVQNQTFLVSIHDYLMATAKGVFEPHVMPEIAEFPAVFEPITV